MIHIPGRQLQLRVIHRRFKNETLILGVARFDYTPWVKLVSNPGKRVALGFRPIKKNLRNFYPMKTC